MTNRIEACQSVSGRIETRTPLMQRQDSRVGEETTEDLPDRPVILGRPFQGLDRLPEEESVSRACVFHAVFHARQQQAIKRRTFR